MLKVSGEFTMPESGSTSKNYLKVYIPDNTSRILCGNEEKGFPVADFYNKGENVAKVQLEFTLTERCEQNCCIFKIKYDGKTRFMQACNLSCLL